jgi:hypothetical protein
VLRKTTESFAWNANEKLSSGGLGHRGFNWAWMQGDGRGGRGKHVTCRQRQMCTREEANLGRGI